MEEWIYLVIGVVGSIFILQLSSFQLEKWVEVEKSLAVIYSQRLVERASMLRSMSEGSFDRFEIFLPKGSSIFADAERDVLVVDDGNRREIKFPGDILYNVTIGEGKSEVVLVFGTKEQEDKDKLTIIFR